VNCSAKPTKDFPTPFLLPYQTKPERNFQGGGKATIQMNTHIQSLPIQWFSETKPPFFLRHRSPYQRKHSRLSRTLIMYCRVGNKNMTAKLSIKLSAYLMFISKPGRKISPF